MQSRAMPIILGLLGLVAFLGWSSIFVVNEREQAIVTRFGEISRIESEPGIYFKVPTTFVENVQFIDDRLLRFDLEDIRVQVSDGKFYDVDAFLVYSIEDARLFRQNITGGNLEFAEQRLRTRLDSALRQVYGLRGFEAALSEERAAMMKEVRDQLVSDARTLGIAIQDVRIRRTDLTPQVSSETYARMSAERLAEAEGLRARGRENAQRIRAIAQRQAVEITAEARRESEVIRGEGDAERNAIFADAFERDPEFFAFQRSLKAYENALRAGDTTYVLDPSSEFFQYFGQEQLGGRSPRIAAPGQ